MEIESALPPGMSWEEMFVVEEQHSAAHVGSGSVRVLATPWMIAFMERAARLLLASVLPEGQSSVGVHLDVRHLAPTPVGARVRAIARVVAMEGAKVDFEVQVWDELEQVGAGTHQRVVIDEQRFLRRVSAKTQQLSASASE